MFLIPVGHAGFVILLQLYRRPDLGIAEVIKAVFHAVLRFGDFFAEFVFDGFDDVGDVEEADGARWEVKFFVDVHQVIPRRGGYQDNIVMVEHFHEIVGEMATFSRRQASRIQDARVCLDYHDFEVLFGV